MTKYTPKYTRPTDALTKRHLDKFEDRMIKWRDGEARKRQRLAQKVRDLEDLVKAAFED